MPKQYAWAVLSASLAWTSVVTTAQAEELQAALVAAAALVQITNACSSRWTAHYHQRRAASFSVQSSR